MANVKAKIITGNAEFGDITHKPKEGEQQRRRIAKKGSVVEMSKEDFDSLASIKAVEKAKDDDIVADAAEPVPGSTLPKNGK
jgi:hypothetical protein